MKILMAQPANIRFQWEVDVAITNIRSHTDMPIVVVFMEEDPTVLEHFKGRYEGVEVYHYPDNRFRKDYVPTIKPYLVWKYLEANPSEETEDFFFVDSDVIFREMVDLSKMPLEGQVAWGSDCDGYLGYEYLNTRDNNEVILNVMSHCSGLSREEIKEIPGAGAQWVISKPTATLFEDIYHLSQDIWDNINLLPTNLQKWTAEMWAQLYALYKHGWEIKITPELKFCWPTDSIEMWQHSKILHNSGVVGESAAGLFFKGKYQHHTPFEEDLSWVRKDRCSWHYKEAIEAAKKSV